MSNSEANIIEGLKAEDNSTILELYQAIKPKAVKLITDMGGQHEEAIDLIQDGLVCLIENLRNDKFKGKSKIHTYLLSIIKYAYLNKKRTNKNMRVEDLSVLEIGDKASYDMLHENAYDIKEARLNLIEEHMHRLSEECKSIIQNFYYKNLNMKEIAKSLKYTDAFVRVKKNRCMKKLRESIL